MLRKTQLGNGCSSGAPGGPRELGNHSGEAPGARSGPPGGTPRDHPLTPGGPAGEEATPGRPREVGTTAHYSTPCVRFAPEGETLIFVISVIFLRGRKTKDSNTLDRSERVGGLNSTFLERTTSLHYYVPLGSDTSGPHTQ